MKILQVGKYYHPHHGGIETVVKSLSQGLIQAGDEVTMLCSSDSRSSSEEWLEGVRVLRWGTATTQLSQPISPGLLRYLARLGSPADFDLVHFHSPNPVPEIAWLCLRKKIPFVVTYHADVVRQRFTRRFYWQALRRFLSEAGRICVATRFHIVHSPVLTEFESKCAVIPFGLDQETCRLTEAPDKDLLAKASEIRQRYGKFVLFVGRLVPYKGLSHLLGAMKSLDASVVVVGEGPLGNELRAEAAALGIGGRAHFLGGVKSHRDLMAHFLACELFALPSINQSEAFGMVLLEALACGKPVVTTRIPSGVNFVNQEGVTGLVAEPESSESLARAIGAILSDGALRETMARAARERFLAHFTQDRMIQGYRETYQSVVSGFARH